MKQGARRCRQEQRKALPAKGVGLYLLKCDRFARLQIAGHVPQLLDRPDAALRHVVVPILLLLLFLLLGDGARLATSVCLLFLCAWAKLKRNLFCLVALETVDGGPQARGRHIRQSAKAP